MAWKDNLLDASFKGANFKVSSSSAGFGRRTTLHQYANRDKPYLQDTGSDADEYIIEGYIIQNADNGFDYFAERDSLIVALKSKGAGLLIHPYLGIKRVGLVGKAQIKEEVGEGGMATFSMVFVEAGSRALPVSLLDFLTSIDDKINQGFDRIGDAFYAAYEVTGAFTGVVSTFTRGLNSIIQGGLSALEGISTKVINEVKYNVNSIQNTIASVLTSPVDMFNSIKNSVASFPILSGMGVKVLEENSSTLGSYTEDEVPTNERVTDSFINSMVISSIVTGGETGSYSGITRGDVTELTGNEIPEVLGLSVINAMMNIATVDITDFVPEEQQLNIALIYDTYRYLLIGYACRIAIRTDFFSQDQLLEYLGIIVDTINTILIDLGDEAAYGTDEVGIGIVNSKEVRNKDIFIEFERIREIFYSNMLLKAEELAKTIDYTIGNDVKSVLELAYDKYEDIERMQDIFYRNKSIIKNPCFLPNGQTIKILSA